MTHSLAVSIPPRAPGDPELDLRVQTHLPRTLPAGCATALFVLGSCFHRRLPIRRLEMLVDGVATDVAAQGMPRLDLHSALHPDRDLASMPGGNSTHADDPYLHSYRSGFWASVPVRMPDLGGIELGVRATLADRTRVEASIASITMADPADEPHDASSPGAAGARVAIAMATFDPNLDLFRAQIDSIRAQTIDDWICLVSDDCTSPAAFERIESVIGGDDRFVVSRAPERLGFYKNFERALRMASGEAELVALADHDDRWYPEKLATLVAGLGDAQLVYSDQRVVDSDGRVLADSYWSGERTNNHTNLASLLIANTITGAASLFRRELLDVALPFPDPPGSQFHDHWLGLVALATGGIAYVDRPLYDYVQHQDSALGHVAANVGPASRRYRRLLARLRRRDWGGIVSGWRAAYFFAVFRSRLLAEVLLMRCGGRMDRRSRWVLGLLTRTEHSPLAILWLGARRARRWVGKTETLDAERLLLQGILWRYAIRALVVGRRSPRLRVPYDAGLPKSAGGAKAPPSPRRKA